MTLKRDEIGLNRHRALVRFFEHDRFGKPLHTFPDHALVAKFEIGSGLIWVCDPRHGKPRHCAA